MLDPWQGYQAQFWKGITQRPILPGLLSFSWMIVEEFCKSMLVKIKKPLICIFGKDHYQLNTNFKKFHFFNNSNHSGWRIGLVDTFLKREHLNSIIARIGLIYMCVREEYLLKQSCKLITYVMLSSKCNYNSNYNSMVENYMNGFVGSLDRHVLLPMFYL